MTKIEELEHREAAAAASDLKMPTEAQILGIKIRTKAQCVECGRVFNLLDVEEAGEWYYGHDCEAE